METWTVTKLKAELRGCGASLRGKKADLIARLQAYIRNNNFIQEDAQKAEEVSFKMVKPEPEAYRDIHGATILPKVNSQRLDLFLKRFGKSLDNKPLRLYQGQYLQYARFAETPSGTFVSGRCRAQMKQVCYEVDLLLQSDGSVVESQCECAAGEGPNSHCKHVVVLLLAVQDVVEHEKIVTAEVCTQKLQTFHKPKRPFHGSPVKSANLRKNCGNGSSFDPRPHHVIDLPHYQSIVNNLCINYAANKFLSSSRMPLMQSIPPANPFAVANDHDYVGDHKSQLMNKLKLHNLSDEDRNQIELTTRGQSQNKAWKTARACRLTSSHFKAIVCATERKDMKLLAKSIAEPTSFISRATEHVVVNESVAIKQFERQRGVVVQQCGLFVVPSHNFLGASPDGLLFDLTVVEVKCPFSSRYMKITPQTVPYLELINGELSSKKKHQYYYQIQGQLLASQRDFCDFVVYTYVDMIIISITRDQDFIDSMLPALQNFFDEYFLPHLLDLHLYHGYTGQS